VGTSDRQAVDISDFSYKSLVGANAATFIMVSFEVGSSGPMMKSFTHPEFSQFLKLSWHLVTS
jgi:hypothetical protein